jgi:hypothetical protein
MGQCYALRKKLGLRVSSNPVEKANDLLASNKQKHQGMSWSADGSKGGNIDVFSQR